MGLEIGRAFFAIAGDTMGLTSSVDQARPEVEHQMEGMATSVADSIEGMMQQVTSSITGMMTMITAKAAAVTGAMYMMGQAFARTGDTIDKMSHRTGVSREALQKLEFAAQQSGASIGDVESSIRRLHRRMDSASPRFVESLKQIGLHLDDLKKMKPEDQFTTLINALGGVEDPTKRAGIAMQVLGRTGTRLAAMMAEGSDGLSNLREEAIALGIVMSERYIKLAAEMTDAWNRLTRQLGAVRNYISAAVAPVLIEFTDRVQGILRASIDWIKANENLIRNLFIVSATIAKFAGGFVALRGGIWAAKIATRMYTTFIGSFIKSTLLATKATLGWAAGMFTLSGAAKSAAIAIRFLGMTIKKALIGTGVGAILVAAGLAIWGIIKGVQRLIAWVTSLESIQRSLIVAGQNLMAAWHALKQAGEAVWSALSQAINNVVDTIANYLGIELDTLPGRVEDAVNFMIRSVSEFALTVASYTAAIVQNWQTVWELIKTWIALKMMESADSVSTFWNTVKAHGAAFGVYIWETLKGITNNVVALFEGVGRVVLGVIKGLWQGLKAIFTGGDFRSAFRQAWEQEMSKMQRGFVSTQEEAARKAGDAFARHTGSESPLAGTISTLQDDVTRLMGNLSQEADKIKQQSLATVAGRNAEEEEALDKEIDEEPPPREVVHIIEAGKYGIAQLGQRFQDTLMRDKKGSIEEKMLGVQQRGNSIQEKLLGKQDEVIKAIEESGGREMVLT